jgi:ketosteroid isomerase-like protein
MQIEPSHPLPLLSHRRVGGPGPRQGFARVLAVLLALCCVLTTAAHAKQPLRELTAQSRPVAERYFKAYIDRQWDVLEPLLADEAVFSDPTAATIWGGVGKVGKAAVMKGFREGYAIIVDMRFKPLRTLASGHHVVFEGELDWTVKGQSGRHIRSTGAFIVHLEVHDGRVTAHQDLLDYQPFVDALNTR